MAVVAVVSVVVDVIVVAAAAALAGGSTVRIAKTPKEGVDGASGSVSVSNPVVSPMVIARTASATASSSAEGSKKMFEDIAATRRIIGGVGVGDDGSLPCLFLVLSVLMGEVEVDVDDDETG